MSAQGFAGLHWRKSTYSNGQQECVEVANLPDNRKAVRDSKLGDESPILTVDRSGWSYLVGALKAGESS
ncbi:DUF397 domain-containing protein [Amycolatopsis sp. cg5]|uniref:DUF397 domain-containing protein n=1 Tax=Amycolatopsis sp. cg5 TaxID=3238802 RepID=UPI00352322ED